MDSSFYRQIGAGRFDSGPLSAGPWGPDAQHAGPPAALLAREFGAHGDIGAKRIASISIDILSPVPLSVLDVEVKTEKPGANVELLSGTVSADGKVVMSARAWRVLRAPGDIPALVLARHVARARGPASCTHAGRLCGRLSPRRRLALCSRRHVSPGAQQRLATSTRALGRGRSICRRRRARHVMRRFR